MADDDDKKIKQAARGRPRRQGALSAQSLDALDVVDVGAQIQAGLGVTIDDVGASEVVLRDDDARRLGSRSQRAGNADAVRDGHNFVLDALARLASRRGEVLAHTRYLNGHVLYPYTPLEHAVRMTRANYNPSLGTPLYDQTVVVLGTVIAKSQELAAGRHRGAHRHADHHRRRRLRLDALQGRPTSRRSSRDMLAQENHIVAAMGISDGTTDFRSGVPRDGHPRPLDPHARQQRERDPPRVPGVLAVRGARVAGRAARRLRELIRRTAGQRLNWNTMVVSNARRVRSP